MHGEAPAACLSPRQHHFATHENEDHDLGRHHAVDQAREQLWLILRQGTVCQFSKPACTQRSRAAAAHVRELRMRVGQAFQPDREADVAGGHNVLDCEVL